MQISKRKLLVERFMIDLPQLDLVTKSDRDARDLYLDKLAVCISSGGREFFIFYGFAFAFVPMIFRTLPRHMIRFPMFLFLCLKYEEMYYFGANLKLRYYSIRILNQMKSLNEGSKLKSYAEDLSKSLNI